MPIVFLVYISRKCKRSTNTFLCLGGPFVFACQHFPFFLIQNTMGNRFELVLCLILFSFYSHFGFPSQTRFISPSFPARSISSSFRSALFRPSLPCTRRHLSQLRLCVPTHSLRCRRLSARRRDQDTACHPPPVVYRP